MPRNQVIRVTLSSGIIGMIVSDPRTALQRAVEQANREGWRVQQIIPDSHQNLVQLLVRLVILLLTLLLWAPANGFFIVLERPLPATASTPALEEANWQITE